MADPLAAGIHALALPELAGGFAAVLGAHRFFDNPHVRLPQLGQPLLHFAQQWDQHNPHDWALVIHDWSVLAYPHHPSKKDCIPIHKGHGRGYELTTVLLVDGRQGNPVAPLELRLQSAHGLFSSRTPPPALTTSHIDEVLPSMQAIARLRLGRPLVHVIDREGDSLAHYRDWQAAGQSFLVRGRGRRKVRWQGQEVSVAEIGGRLQQQGQFQRCGEVSYRGKTAVQRVAETTVILERPAWRHRRRGGAVHYQVPGPPITLRLVISRVCDSRGRTLAIWYLLTNLPLAVDGVRVALWYYWRWRIECLFKLSKSAGYQVERWQQQTGEAIAKRLLVVAMACVLVWQIQGEPTAEGARLRGVLLRLSGRQRKRGREATTSALLAGLWVLVTMLEVLNEQSVAELQRFKRLLLDTTEEESG